MRAWTAELLPEAYVRSKLLEIKDCPFLIKVADCPLEIVSCSYILWAGENGDGGLKDEDELLFYGFLFVYSLIV